MLGPEKVRKKSPLIQIKRYLSGQSFSTVRKSGTNSDCTGIAEGKGYQTTLRQVHALLGIPYGMFPVGWHSGRALCWAFLSFHSFQACGWQSHDHRFYLVSFLPLNSLLCIQHALLRPVLKPLGSSSILSPFRIQQVIPHYLPESAT